MGSLRSLRQKKREKLSLSDLKELLASLTFQEKQQLYQDLEGRPDLTIAQYLDILVRSS